jgi:sodium pump decarboxylase gamma subunit
MLEGLVVCVIGVAVVFVALAVLMFVIMVMGRFLGGEGEAEEKRDAGDKTKADEISPGTIQPVDSAEVAAIAVAVASYMKLSGRQLGPYITINAVEYQLDIGELYPPPISVEVNGERFWATLNGEGLPVVTQPELKLGILPRAASRGAIWRSAYPLPQGRFWLRGGWTGRQGAGMEKK